MNFAHPWVLLLLIAPVLLVWWEWRRRGRPLVLPLDYSQGRSRNWLERVIKCANVLPPLLLAVGILILAGPQRLATPEDERVLTNIEVVLDVSGSMMAQFGDGTRADKAFEAIVDFTSFRKGDAFGLTIFGTEVVQKAMGVKTGVKHLDARKEVVHAYSDHSKAASILNYHPKIGLEQGIEQMVDWVKAVGPCEPVEFKGIEVEKNMPPSWRAVVTA